MKGDIPIMIRKALDGEACLAEDLLSVCAVCSGGVHWSTWRFRTVTVSLCRGYGVDWYCLEKMLLVAIHSMKHSDFQNAFLITLCSYFSLEKIRGKYNYN